MLGPPLPLFLVVLRVRPVLLLVNQVLQRFRANVVTALALEDEGDEETGDGTDQYGADKDENKGAG